MALNTESWAPTRAAILSNGIVLSTLTPPQQIPTVGDSTKLVHVESPTLRLFWNQETAQGSPKKALQEAQAIQMKFLQQCFASKSCNLAGWKPFYWPMELQWSIFLSFWVGSFPYSSIVFEKKRDPSSRFPPQFSVQVLVKIRPAKQNRMFLLWPQQKKRHSIYSGLVLLTKQCRTITGAIPTKSPWPEASREESSRKGVTPTLSLTFLFKSFRSNSIYSGLHAIFLQNGEKPIRQTTVVVAGASKIFRRTPLTAYNQKHLPVNTWLPPKGSIHHVFDSLWQSFPIWISIRFLFLLSLPWDTAVVISNKKQPSKWWRAACSWSLHLPNINPWSLKGDCVTVLAKLLADACSRLFTSFQNLLVHSDSDATTSNSTSIISISIKWTLGPHPAYVLAISDLTSTFGFRARNLDPRCNFPTALQKKSDEQSEVVRNNMSASNSNNKNCFWI